jgi:hypothetical protein
MTGGPGEIVPLLLQAHPAVRSARLVGSRAHGNPGPLSDWDFELDCDDVDAVVGNLPALLELLQPLAFVPDPLARHVVVAAILPDPAKVDLIFQAGHEPEPAWTASAETLVGMDRHFWDWVLWLAGKQLKGEGAFVREQLRLLADYLLAPLGVEKMPVSLEEAVSSYKQARDDWTPRLSVPVPPELGEAVERALAGYGLVTQA